MNMTFSTSTRIAPIVDVSTYDGPFGYESLWSVDEESEREEGRLVCDDYDSAKMKERIVEEANRVFAAENPLQQYGVVSVKATKFRSPREYNFMSDWLDLSVEVDDSFWQLAKATIFKPENRAKIVEYAGNHWVSYDGFLSSMLNRISGLSRDHWKHTHYGTHMATDKEVEDALLADLEEAFDHLEHGTGDDDFREFGAILALLWLVEYPYDFDRGGSPCESWVTDAMVEHLRGNSSLSEFCTVLDEEEVRKLYGDWLPDAAVNGDLDRLRYQVDRYKASPKDSPDADAKAEALLARVRKLADGVKAKARGIVADYHTGRWPDDEHRRRAEHNIRTQLDELLGKWNSAAELGWPEGRKP